MNREQRLQQCLQPLQPLRIELVNESHGHNVAANSETHFKLTLVSERFQGLRAVQRHQLVYGLVNAEWQSGLHALAMHLYSPDEWSGNSPESPACMGGSKK